MEEVSLSIPESFEHLGNGEYRFCCTVQKVYKGEDRNTVVILQADDFRFYTMSEESDSYVQRGRYSGEGTLLLDHYYWVEFLESYQDPPNLFFNLR